MKKFTHLEIPIEIDHFTIFARLCLKPFSNSITIDRNVPPLLSVNAAAGINAAGENSRSIGIAPHK